MIMIIIKSDEEVNMIDSLQLLVSSPVSVPVNI
jgi:hypothetical protein